MNTTIEIQKIQIALEKGNYRVYQETIKFFRASVNDQIANYAKDVKLNSSRAVLISVLTEIKNMLVEEEKKVNNSANKHDFNKGSGQTCQALMTTQNWNEILDKVFPEYKEYLPPTPKPVECIDPPEKIDIRHYWTNEYTPSKTLMIVK